MIIYNLYIIYIYCNGVKTRALHIVKEDPLSNNNVIFEAEHIEPIEMPIVLNSVDLKREEHPPFYVSLS